MSEAERYAQLINTPLRRIGYDFDGTIAKSLWPIRHAGPPIKKNIELIKQQYEDGFEIEIFTARADSDREYLEDWLIRHDVPFSRVICGKPLFNEYYGNEAHNA